MLKSLLVGWDTQCTESLPHPIDTRVKVLLFMAAMNTMALILWCPSKVLAPLPPFRWTKHHTKLCIQIDHNIWIIWETYRLTIKKIMLQAITRVIRPLPVPLFGTVGTASMFLCAKSQVLPKLAGWAVPLSKYRTISFSHADGFVS